MTFIFHDIHSSMASTSSSPSNISQISIIFISYFLMNLSIQQKSIKENSEHEWVNIHEQVECELNHFVMWLRSALSVY